MREHWHIENRPHWVCDVSFGENYCRVSRGNGPQNRAAFRFAAVAVLCYAGFTGIAAAFRHLTNHLEELLQLTGI